MRLITSASPATSSGRRAGRLTAPIVTCDVRAEPVEGSPFRVVTFGANVTGVSTDVTPRRAGRSPDRESRWTRGHSSPITLQLVGPQTWTEVPALLCYDAADPFAVRIAFGNVGDENGIVDADEAGIAWLVSRELLQAGLDRPSGEGDVRVWPAHGA